MKIVKVTYTTKPEYVEHNSGNIQKVMSDLQKLNVPGLFYHACKGEDNKTFIHTAFFKSEEQEKILFDLPSFQLFREQLKSSVPEVSPKNELLTLIGPSSDIY